ncbi:MAG TPA: hypothetical protein VN739_02200 [Nitrososphaerales archaeon]|nr:hypothetical protein [Nitrososphaerales archaeon]
MEPRIMVPQPRWTIPINMRSRDKPMLDAALEIAKIEGLDLTSIFRNALQEYITSRLDSLKDDGIKKMEEYLDSSSVLHSLLLSPDKLKGWTDSEVVTFAKLIRARKEELEIELRKRDYYFRW